MIHSEANVHDEVEHNLQIWLIPSKRPTPFAYNQLKYTPEERQGRFRLYVSPDGRDGSMPIHTDAAISAGLFTAGETASHRLGRGRGSWVQIVRGSVDVAGVTLESGDGVGINGMDQLDFAFRADAELLLFDLGMDAPLTWR
jgi:redox-sensitive bicupin YhaK (pirin superfamily)